MYIVPIDKVHEIARKLYNGGVSNIPTEVAAMIYLAETIREATEQLSAQLREVRISVDNIPVGLGE